MHKNTFTFCIKQLGKPNAYVDLRNAKKDPNLDYYLSKPLTIMYGAGASEWGTDIQTTDIGKAFDGIIYLNKVHEINRTNLK
jgi:hypothetical protein